MVRLWYDVGMVLEGDCLGMLTVNINSLLAIWIVEVNKYCILFVFVYCILYYVDKHIISC